MHDPISVVIDQRLRAIITPPDEPKQLYIPSPQPFKRKSGIRGWRITGSRDFWFLRDGRVFCADPADNNRGIAITDKPWAELGLPYNGIRRWEYLALMHGRERLETELRDALCEAGHAADVEIGRNGADAATVSVIPLAARIKHRAGPNEATLAELLQLDQELTTVSETIDQLKRRLHSLVIGLVSEG